MNNTVFMIGKQKKDFYYVFLIVCSFFFFFFVNYTVFASSDGSHHSPGWLSTDTFRVFNFLVLVLALFLILRKPISNALGSRVDDIRDNLEDLKKRKAQVEAEVLESEKRLADLNKEVDVLISDYIKQGEEVKTRIISEAKITADKLNDQAKKSIDREFERAKFDLQREIVDKSLVKAEEIIKKKIDSDDQERLINEYTNKVVA